jgi:hypothetical protein
MMMGAMLAQGDLDGGRAIGSTIGMIVPREIAAGVARAHRSENVATLTSGLAHDVSILLGVGRHLGRQPREKISTTIMRAAIIPVATRV